MKLRYIQAFLVLCLVLSLTQCRFLNISQPDVISPGATFQIEMDVLVELEDSNPHHGVLCILAPEEWSVLSAAYTSSIGNGILKLSPEWTDSAEACYPAEQFGPEMTWLGFISDTSYANPSSLPINVTLQLQVGQTEGCFKLGYIVTKATQDLICSGNPSWAPFSYPNIISVSSAGEPCDTVRVERALDWDDLLNRSSGWTGADGIYSIPLSGIEIPEQNPQETTLLLFSDTFIGEVDSNNQRLNSSLVNNTYAILKGNQPLNDSIAFIWGLDQNNNPDAIFTPDTSYAEPDEWFWLMDGVALSDSIYVFGLRVEPASGGFGFALSGVSLLSFVLDSNYAIHNYKQKDTPVYYRNEMENWEIVHGQAVMPMTIESGNPNPDGYIYVYGPKNTSQGKELVAARVLPQDIADFSQWRYWDGNSWTAQIDNSFPITNGISQEFSVSALNNGKFILVFLLNNSVGYRIGDSPVGPFGVMNLIYDCPEINEDPDIFVYNAKAHPHLSSNNELLISYNVNTFDFWDHFTNADIYRPRFIRLTIPKDSILTISDEITTISEAYLLQQNFPNPFNLATAIVYRVMSRSKVVLKIFNILGQEITTLVNKFQSPGSYTVFWDGKDDANNIVSSGTYIYRIQVRDRYQTKKMVLIK
jgi:hypothetical protein